MKMKTKAWLAVIVVLVALACIWAFLFMRSSSVIVDSELFFTHNGTGIIEVSAEDVSHIKLNLHEYNGLLYWANPYRRKKLSEEGTIISVVVGVYLIKTIDGELIDDVIDVETYESIRPNHIYRDVNNVYFVDYSRGCRHCLMVLSRNAAHFKVLDAEAEYGTDGLHVFCLRNGEKLTISMNYHIEITDGRTWLTDGHFSYQMCDLRPK